MICVGASSYANMAQAYDYFRPLVNDCMDTPENEASEQRLIQAGEVHETVTRVLLKTRVLENGRTEAVYKGDKPRAVAAGSKKKRKSKGV